MNRSQLEHIIRAAGAIAEDDEIVVIGSQSVLGAFPAAPSLLLVSIEADVYPRNYPDRWNLIDGSIGEGSMFHETFGYYAQGVGPETAMLPEGWQERLVAVRGPATRGVTGWCLDVRDLLVSKAFAGRPKDSRFVSVAFEAGLASVDECTALATRVDATPDAIVRAQTALRTALRTAGGRGED